MDPLVVVEPSLKGMHLSRYLHSFVSRKIDGTSYYDTLDVNGFLEVVRNWTETNHNDLPQLFLPAEFETEAMRLRVRLPYTNHASCPRDGNHTAEESGIDQFGRVICRHHNYINVPLGREGFSTSFEWDRLAAKVKPVVKFVETPGAFSASSASYQASLRDKQPVLITESCDAVIDDTGSLLPLEYIVRKENSSHNNILALYEWRRHDQHDQFTQVFQPTPSRDIPQRIVRDKKTYNLASKRELLSFDYDHAHTAYLVKLWWAQGNLKGAAPLLREVNAHGPLEDYS